MTTPTRPPASPALAQLEARLQSPDAGIPVLPSLAHQVIALTGDADTPAWKLASVIQKDQVLTAKTLGLANSAYCASMQRVSTVMDALLRMGTAAARNLVMTVCFTSRMYDQRVYGPAGKTLMDHGLGTAYLARLVAERAGVNPDEAFLVGLLHDLGKLVILKTAFDLKRSGAALTPAEVDEVMGDKHAALGGRVLKRWNLPDEISVPVTWHHQPDLAATHQRASSVAYVADLLSHHYGFGCEPSPDLDVLADPVAIRLGIDEAWLGSASERAPGLFEVAKTVLAA